MQTSVRDEKAKPRSRARRRTQSWAWTLVRIGGGEPGRFRIDAPCVGMQVAQIGQTHAVRDGNKNDRILVRYSSVRYSHRLGYAQPSRGSLWLWGELWSSRASTSSSQPPLAAHLVRSSLRAGDAQQGFVPRSLLMGGTWEARCKPEMNEGDAEELGDDEPWPHRMHRVSPAAPPMPV